MRIFIISNRELVAITVAAVNFLVMILYSNCSSLYCCSLGSYVSHLWYCHGASGQLSCDISLLLTSDHLELNGLTSHLFFLCHLFYSLRVHFLYFHHLSLRYPNFSFNNGLLWSFATCGNWGLWANFFCFYFWRLLWCMFCC